MIPRTFFLLYCIQLICTSLTAQLPDRLNTAAGCTWMLPEEREMLREINLLRSNPPGYIKYIQPLLAEALAVQRKEGRGSRHYALTFTRTQVSGKDTERIDTTWFYRNEEEVKALRSLIKDLQRLKPLSVLQPDSGIYAAVKYFGADQTLHSWNLGHTGSDGSYPWDRIRRFSPRMRFGNENIAGCYPEPSPATIVQQLLIDSGIPGYGHRYNLLNPSWTHAACLAAGLHNGAYRWLQNFGAAGK